MYAFGVGATVDLPNFSVVVEGLDSWNELSQEVIPEPRLLAAVRAELGAQVGELRSAPWLEETKNAFDSWAWTGVPVLPFPRWLRCPRCQLLAPVESGLFQLRGTHTAQISRATSTRTARPKANRRQWSRLASSSRAHAGTSTSFRGWSSATRIRHARDIRRSLHTRQEPVPVRRTSRSECEVCVGSVICPCLRRERVADHAAVPRPTPAPKSIRWWLHRAR